MPTHSHAHTHTEVKLVTHVRTHAHSHARALRVQANLASAKDLDAEASSDRPNWPPQWVEARRGGDPCGIHLASLAAVVALQCTVHSTGLPASFTFEALRLLLSHQLCRLCLRDLLGVSQTPGTVSLADLEMIWLSPSRLSEAKNFVAGAAVLEVAELEQARFRLARARLCVPNPMPCGASMCAFHALSAAHPIFSSTARAHITRIPNMPSDCS